MTEYWLYYSIIRPNIDANYFLKIALSHCMLLLFGPVPTILLIKHVSFYLLIPKCHFDAFKILVLSISDMTMMIR